MDVPVLWCWFRRRIFVFKDESRASQWSLCANSSWINFCQLWLKCGILEVSGAIVSCFILLLAPLAPATINPTVVLQELQVIVAMVTVVQPDWHHYSSASGHDSYHWSPRLRRTSWEDENSSEILCQRDDLVKATPVLLCAVNIDVSLKTILSWTVNSPG